MRQAQAGKKPYSPFGQGLNVYAGGNDWDAEGTSIFDPVLCEVAYRWFCPPHGLIIDPFAGGSVRGIVAGYLGYKYTGIDLSGDQLKANRTQWDRIRERMERPEDDATIRISAKSLKQLFTPCSPDFIRDVCHAHCCESSKKGTLITIHPTEEKRITELGGVVEDGLLVSKNKVNKCSFKDDCDLCTLHGSPDKPFGCVVSPFTITKNNTLIVRNRYRMLKCFKGPGAQPAYQAHRLSLVSLFGEEMTSDIIRRVEDGEDGFSVETKQGTIDKLKRNDAIKKGANGKSGGVEWIEGNSETYKLAKESADLIFSCPPYFDLEKYSDDKKDLSNMTWPGFLKSLQTIAQNCFLWLKPNRFAAFVIGDIRDKKTGHYRRFVAEFTQIMNRAGLSLYNEAILINSLGSLPLRAGRVFKASRKLGKTHQNILIFVKGSWQEAVEACGEIEIEEEELTNEEIN